MRKLPAAEHVAFIRSTREEPAARTAEFFSLNEPRGPFELLGRIRLDDRAGLRRKLQHRAADRSDRRSDGWLCLQAYETWGEGFLEHLAGDFSFALWDGRQRRLLVARDQLGVRPLFHARFGDLWLIGDSLSWIASRAPSPLVLDDHWIADFLTLGCSRELERTVYRDIRRLPPAHVLRLTEEGCSIRQYWRLELEAPLWLRRRAEYGERFRALVVDAISDRLPDGRVGVAMSGGLDSTTLAALAVETIGDPTRVVAECEHYERLMHIGEDRFAKLAARHLGIDLTIRPCDDLAYDTHWRSRGIRSDEPTKLIIDAHHGSTIDTLLGARADVWFEGEGPDNALTLDRNPYLRWLAGRRSWGRLAGALLQYIQVKGAMGWAQSVARHMRWRGAEAPATGMPPWLQPAFVADVRLAERVDALGEVGDRSHPWHPHAVSSFTSAFWQRYFDDIAFRETLSPIVHRHPFLDLRVLQFMLSVPPIPWGWKKQLVREAMRGRLPTEILRREKTPLAGFPEVAIVRQTGLPALSVSTRLARYVDFARLPDLNAPEVDIDGLIAVHALDYWLASTPAVP